MTTTTGDPSSLKTPSTLSGGDLVSRFLAATPPYLYNVPLTPHSFFFSEMLRSFVQSKAEAGTSGTSNGVGNAVRRRKRTWRDARERPLELTTTTTTTTKDKPHHHLHHHHHHHHDHPNHHHHQQKDKYYGIQQPQQQSQPELHGENRFKSHETPEESSTYGNESIHKRTSNYEQKTNPYTMMEPLKQIDDNRPDFSKQNRDFYDDSSRRFSSEQTAHQVAIFTAASQKIKPEEQSQQQHSQREITEDDKTRDATPERNIINEERAKIVNQDLSFFADQKNKLQELAGRNFLPGLSGIPRLDEQNKNFALSGVPNTPDFLPSGPLWYPPYPAMPQSYPAIDPLHFFIDLRVSGHIWDRKMNERQLPFKSKHCSAFSVPQTNKEYNRPLDLTRDEAATSSITSRNNSNQRGTHFILKNLNDTYKDIREMEKSNNVIDTTTSSKSSNSDDISSKDSQGRSLSKNDASSYSSSSGDHRQQKEKENEGKDRRALIGLELVVDCVKEPKEDFNIDEEQSPDVGE